LNKTHNLRKWRTRGRTFKGLYVVINGENQAGKTKIYEKGEANYRGLTREFTPVECYIKP